MMTKVEREVLAAADHAVRKAEFEDEFGPETEQPWEAREGEALSIADFRALPAGSDEREVWMFTQLNELWNMLDHIMAHLPCAGGEDEGDA